MRVVLDTNVVISALLHRGPTRRFLELWRTGRIQPLASQPVLDEYVRVLHYPKFGYEPEMIAGILQEDLLPWFKKVENHPGPLSHRPQDKSDEIFLRAAIAGKAAALVSGDTHLIQLEGKYSFRILSPGLFLAGFKG